MKWWKVELRIAVSVEGDQSEDARIAALELIARYPDCLDGDILTVEEIRSPVNPDLED